MSVSCKVAYDWKSTVASSYWSFFFCDDILKDVVKWMPVPVVDDNDGMLFLHNIGLSFVAIKVDYFVCDCENQKVIAHGRYEESNVCKCLNEMW